MEQQGLRTREESPFIEEALREAAGEQRNITFTNIFESSAVDAEINEENCITTFLSLCF